jgi:subtilisin family serine protease
VAPGATLVAVKVLTCSGSGSTSGVIKGVDYVTANATPGRSIANMSLGGGVSQALDDAVIRSAQAGVQYAIAAGNSGADACGSSPARAGVHDGIITVASTVSNETESSFSNFGACVDIWAPGSSILSTKKGGGTTTMSGTSMASPHVGGAGALVLWSQGTAMAPATVEQWLKNEAVIPGTNSKDGRIITRLSVRNF